MPFYSFECQCGHVEPEVLSVKCDPETAAPIHCGKKMEQTFMGGRQSVQEFESTVTTHIHPDGKPLTVRNSGDLKALQREFGVYRVDDPNVHFRGGKAIRREENKHRTYG